MRKASIQFSESDIGAVLLKARLQTSEILGQKRVMWRTLSQIARDETRSRDVRQDKNRIIAAPDFLYSSMWSALFSSCCYFRYIEIFNALASSADFQSITQAAVDGAHVHADVVPIEIYNACKISQSIEMQAIFSCDATALDDCFRDWFPRLIDARDAVAHAHDRLFSRRYDKSIDANIGSRPLTLRGKQHLDGKGLEFVFDFQPDKFVGLLNMIENVVNIHACRPF